MSKFSVRKPLTIFVAALAVLILGVVAYTRMTPDLLPNMDFPYVVIVTAYPGASPETVEEEVTRPLEQSMSTLEHIENVTSTSSESVSVVMLEFEENVNMDTIGVDIQQNILSLSGSWDDSVSSPYVLKINPSLLPVEVAAVSMEDMDTVELSDFVEETILPRLEGVTGVARISAIGSVTRQVHVIIDQDLIDEVNGRLADAVTRQLDDAAEELEKTKADLEEAKSQLENAKKQLDNGKSTLANQTASSEAFINQQTVSALEGRMELQKQLVTLNETVLRLQTTLSVLRPIESSLAGLESREAELTERVEQLEAALQELQLADGRMQQLQEAIAALQDNADSLTPEEIQSILTEAGLPGDLSDLRLPDLSNIELPELDAIDLPDVDLPDPSEVDLPDPSEVDLTDPSEVDLTDPSEVDLPDPSDVELPDPPDVDDSAVPNLDAILAAIYASDEYRAAQEQLAAAQQAVQELDVTPLTAASDLAAAQAQLAAVQGELAAIDGILEPMELSRETLYSTVEEMESGLAQAQSGAELLQDAISQLDEGTLQLSEAMETVSQAKTEGLLQLAEAAAQLNSNAAAVESGLAQVESGLDSIEDSRESSLASADITDTISMSTVSSILSAQNYTMPAGYIQQDGINYMVSIGDEITDVEELKGLLLFDTGKDAIGPVYLADVARVFVTDNSDETYARLDGEHGLILTFEKQSNAATADVTDALAKRFAALENAYPGLRFVPLMDQGEYIHMIVSSILQSLFTGAIFAILVLLLFLRDFRPTFITLVSIPLSLVFAVVLMYFSGVTINMISLSGLAVAVGMLVDNSIVVIENIYRLRTKGATSVQAAVAGTRQVAGAIAASTLTTVCVFLPIVFVQGITRQLFTDLALTMGYSLMASLLVALTLVPAMSRGMLKNVHQPKWKSGSQPGEGRFYRGYRAAIGWSLRHKWAVLLFALALLVGSAALALSKGFSFMPEMDSNTVNITITMPENATREQAVAAADEALARMESVENVETVGAMMGGTSLLASGSGYDVTAYVTLKEGESGAAAGKEIAALCEDLDCEITYDSQMMDMSYLTGSGISVRVYGSDMMSLQTAAQQLSDAFADIPGVTEADPGLEDASPAIHIRVDKNAAMKRGYTVAQLYMEIASRLSTSTTALHMDMDDVTADVLVETGEQITRPQLASMILPRKDAEGDGKTFRLHDVATLENTVSLTSIRRENQRRYLNVTAAVEEGYNVTLVTSGAIAAASALDLPSDVTYEFSGENETTMEAVGQLGLMLLLGVVLVYFIMVAQFQSLKSPFIVMFTIPLAFTGGFLALLICGLDVSVISLIGFVMLTGIIVNNGIVLVDYVNQLRAEGMERREALIEAGATRLRPILMTSLTTVLGLIVMALGRDVGTAMMQPVALVCIGGLMYATLMTLFVVPCIYDWMNKKEIEVVTEEDMDFRE